MSDKNITNSFNTLSLPKSRKSALCNFLLGILFGAFLMYTGSDWSHWPISLIAGIVLGCLWVLSWVDKGIENRAIFFLIGYLGLMIMWYSLYGDMPSFTQLYCLFMGNYLVVLIAYPLLVKLKKKHDA